LSNSFIVTTLVSKRIQHFKANANLILLQHDHILSQHPEQLSNRKLTANLKEDSHFEEAEAVFGMDELNLAIADLGSQKTKLKLQECEISLLSNKDDFLA